jgi:hypothetical protein
VVGTILVIFNFPFKELKIHFIGEISNDAGGLIREWFTVISKAILSLGLFERANFDNFAYKIKSHLKILIYASILYSILIISFLV